MRTVLVTGASRGIGRACAVELAAAGFHVLAGVRSGESAGELGNEGGERIDTIQLDITDPKHIESLADALAGCELFGLVNNAGTAYLGPLECMPVSEIRQQFEVNLFGHIAVTQAALPELRRHRGRIVNISSISGFIGFPFFGAYSSSKFAMEGFSESLRRELRRTGVQVSVVDPGNMDTGIWQKSYVRGRSMELEYSEEALKVYGKRFASADGAAFGPKSRGSVVDVAACVRRALVDERPKADLAVAAGAQAPLPGGKRRSQVLLAQEDFRRSLHR